MKAPSLLWIFIIVAALSSATALDMAARMASDPTPWIPGPVEIGISYLVANIITIVVGVMIKRICKYGKLGISLIVWGSLLLVAALVLFPQT